MPTIPILAYYYNEKEENFIRKYVKNAYRTDSFFFGMINTHNISLLKKEGILFDIQDDSTASQAIPRSITSQPKGTRFFNLRDISTQQTSTLKTHYFLIKLIGPFLPDWKKKLNAANVEIIENLQNHIYKVYTTGSLSSLQKFEFITSARPYETGDTDIIMKRSVLSGFEVFETDNEKVAIYDIRILEEKRENILNFLREKKVDILDIGQGKIRVRMTGTKLLTELSQSDEVEVIEEYTKPQLYNDVARLTIHIDRKVDESLQSIIPYEGDGQIIGVADSGLDTDHPDFEGQIHKILDKGRANDYSDPHGHGTHVAGSVLGNGNASEGFIKGIAPKAKLFFQSVMDKEGGLGGLPLVLNDLFQEAYEEGVRIHNNSWGALADSEYLFNSLEVDEFVYHHKDMLLVISAGNEGSAIQPRNSQPGFVDWLSLGSPATAKNALTVGASRNNRQEGGFAPLTYGQAWPDKYPDNPIREEKVSGDVESMAGFSSRGPCGNESRIKPDVVAPGTDIASARSSLAPASNYWGPYPKNRKYAFMGGTSMAAPIVTGFAALVREYYEREKSHMPSAALLKATIINSTRMLQGKDALADHDFIPNFHQGFGCIDMQQALPNQLHKDLQLTFVDTRQQQKLQFHATGQRFLFRLEVKEGLPLRLCLTWTDPPGRGLQNNLNLFLMHKPRQFKWTGNEHIPRTITSFDRDNNVEIIRVDDPHAGEYLVAVQAANIIFSPQDFALVATAHLNTQLQQL